MSLSAIILSDNNAAPPLCGEWGLSVYIEANGQKILLDAGAGSRFFQNAKQLGIDLAAVDGAVLSHAHFDHANGMSAFLDMNRAAPLYLRESCDERRYSKHGLLPIYIGIRRGLLQRYEDRLVRVTGKYSLGNGIWLEATPVQGQEKLGKEARMYRREGLRFSPDDFSHEQFLTVETGDGIVIFSSCSHCGADRILDAAEKNHPNKRLLGLVGGLHLFRKSEEELRAFAEVLGSYRVERVAVGHCTGEKATEILREKLGDRLIPLSVGLRIEF